MIKIIMLFISHHAIFYHHHHKTSHIYYITTNSLRPCYTYTVLAPALTSFFSFFRMIFSPRKPLQIKGLSIIPKACRLVFLFLFFLHMEHIRSATGSGIVPSPHSIFIFFLSDVLPFLRSLQAAKLPENPSSSLLRCLRSDPDDDDEGFFGDDVDLDDTSFFSSSSSFFSSSSSFFVSSLLSSSLSSSSSSVVFFTAFAELVVRRSLSSLSLSVPLSVFSSSSSVSSSSFDNLGRRFK